MKSKPKALLVLASASPRRKDLLEQLGITPGLIVAPSVDESVLPNELPRDYARRVAAAKAAAVSALHPDAYVLAADAVVACGRRILPKAESDEQVRACLAMLSGRRHRVINGISLAKPDGKTLNRLTETIVQFKKLSNEEISSYVACGEGKGKAGGYAIQGRAAAFVKFISGSYSTVVGLSLYDTMQMLDGTGYFKEQE